MAKTEKGCFFETTVLGIPLLGITETEEIDKN